jgi:hypothetical protein
MLSQFIKEACPLDHSLHFLLLAKDKHQTNAKFVHDRSKVFSGPLVYPNGTRGKDAKIMTQIITKRAKSVGALVAVTFGTIRRLPDAFVHAIERFAVGREK